MKNQITKFGAVLIISLANLFIISSIFAQSPEKMSYQAVIRNTSDALVSNTNIGMQISILQGSVSGTVVFAERHFSTTNDNGLVSLEIGSGTVVSGDFTTIDWANGLFFIKTETDLNGGANYTISGTSQLLSVPYALHAKTAETITGGITETDPVFGAWDKSTGILITESQISDLGTYIETETQTISDVAALNNNLNTQLKNVTNPTDAQDAATKAYVDGLINMLVSNDVLVVDFSANTNITLGAPVNFTDLSAINATTWHWDFGDGNTSALQSPTHTYANLGTYTVSLTAGNGTINITKTKNDYITVTGETEGSFTDSRDNTVYQTVSIGSQVWMAENLKYLPSVVGPGTGSQTTPYYYVYGYDGTNVTSAKATSNYTTYGVLYNWPAAMASSTSSATNPSGVQGICPTGWHLPSDAEWTQLTDYLGGESGAGGKLKETGTTHWYSPNQGATNETGFTALPGGYRGDGGTFYNIGDYGTWWSATEYNPNNAWYRYVYYDDSNVGRGNHSKELGFSVRCVRDF